MTNHPDCCQSNCGCASPNSGFVFGLICGAIIGAVIAIIIYKNNKTEVFEKLSQKIKDFFDNLIKDNSQNSYSKKQPQTTKVVPKKILAPVTVVPEKQEITPVFVKPKKPAPKTFIKPKK